jgi:flagellar biosynthetic protein FliR
MHASDEIFVLLTRLPLLLPAFALVLGRVAGLMLTAPLFGSEAVPLRVRVGIAFALSLIVFPLVSLRLPADLTFARAVGGSVGELMIGLTMGLALTLPFVGVQAAGMIMGQQAGIGLGEVFNPVMNTDSTVLEDIFFLIALMIFVMIGGHRELVRALLDTFEVLPMLSARENHGALDLLTGLLTSAYGLGLRLAAPVLLALLVSTLVMGFLSRTIPQLNILSVGFGVRAMIALAMAGLAVAALESPFTDSLQEALSGVRLLFGLRN